MTKKQQKKLAKGLESLTIEDRTVICPRCKEEIGIGSFTQSQVQSVIREHQRVEKCKAPVITEISRHYVMIDGVRYIAEWYVDLCEYVVEGYYENTSAEVQ